MNWVYLISLEERRTGEGEAAIRGGSREEDAFGGGFVDRVTLVKGKWKTLREEGEIYIIMARFFF